MNFFVILISSLFVLCSASSGDRSPFFQSCISGCVKNNCTENKISFRDGRPDKLYQILFLWTCKDECTYDCIWKTTDAFLERGWDYPQFYGKWPFIRIFGIQEPASVLFSVFNLLANVYMILQFRKNVRRDSPNYFVWHVFCIISCNAWIWSIVFHTRDFPTTELFDYGFAYSMVLASFICMILRMFHDKSILLRGFISVFALLFFANHFLYLGLGKFDYRFNMKINVITGIMGGMGWLIWYIMSRNKRPYAWKILAFQILAGVSLVLELNDFPPLWYTVDAHSLWHLATVPLTVLFYKFVIEDCIDLRREKINHPASGDGKNKKLL